MSDNLYLAGFAALWTLIGVQGLVAVVLVVLALRFLARCLRPRPPRPAATKVVAQLADPDNLTPDELHDAIARLQQRSW